MHRFTISLALFTPLAAQAHPGDHGAGHVLESVVHLLTQPDHLMVALAAAATVTGALVLRRRQQKARENRPMRKR